MGRGERVWAENAGLDPRSLRRDPVEPPRKAHRAKINSDGSLAIPDDLAKRLGLEPGGEVEVVEDTGGIEVRPNIHSLARVYVEPTSRCGLSCRTCVRNTWEEPTGDMAPEAFDRLVSELGRFPSLESVMFSGIGEPTLHPDITGMIRKIKALGLRAEMVSNGTLLDGYRLQELYDSHLDMLWVSLDGATEASYQDIRPGGGFAGIIENLWALQRLNDRGPHRVELGIAFVLMERNQSDLKELGRLARTVGARRVSVSHVLPYSAEMEKEMLCLRTLTLDTFTGAPGKAEIDLPRLDFSETMQQAVYSLLRGLDNLAFAGHRLNVGFRQCRFVKDRSTFVRWDGKIAPCAGLLHAYRTYLFGQERTVSAYAVGDLRTGGIHDAWHSGEYARFRQKIRDFNFAPCHLCGGCALLEKNEEDCYGNTFPACGGCLWAQGVIQCP
jgi:AbrB family looped-hinge helix DNA binding protein